jgi:hypothetical protein
MLILLLLSQNLVGDHFVRRFATDVALHPVAIFARTPRAKSFDRGYTKRRPQVQRRVSDRRHCSRDLPVSASLMRSQIGHFLTFQRTLTPLDSD